MVESRNQIILTKNIKITDMGFLEKNLIPGEHGIVFIINTENEKDRAKVKRILLKMPEITNVTFDSEVFPEEMIVTTKKVLTIENMQKALIPYNFHALKKTLSGL